MGGHRVYIHNLQHMEGESRSLRWTSNCVLCWRMAMHGPLCFTSHDSVMLDQKGLYEQWGQ